MDMTNTVIESWAYGEPEETHLTPEQADAQIARFRQRPDVWRLDCKWEPVQSIVTLVNIADGKPRLSWLMPVI